jgi:hypothetical protein
MSATEKTFPWAGQVDEIGCNFALGHLVTNLPIQLSDENKRTHAETLMCAAGAMAGFAAHISFLGDQAAFDAAVNARQISIVTLNDGRELFFGEAINDMLTTGDIKLAPFRLWNTLAGTAIAHGETEATLPGIEQMFAHVARTLGSEREGFPSVSADHQPQLSAREAMRVVGPLAVQCFSGRISETTDRMGFRCAQTSWVAVAAQAAATFLAQASSVLAPRISAQIAMESAIYMSKMRPAVPPTVN